VLAHRLLLTAETQISGRTAEDALTKIVGSVPIPSDQTARL